MEKVSINGPYNYFKLTNGEKTICLFSDVHRESKNQSECVNSENSIDIDHFLKEFMINSNKSNKEYDLFIEHEYTWINSKKALHNYRDGYLHRVRKLFSKNMDFDLSNNKIIKSSNYDNIRFHYFDFRFNTIPEFNTIFNLKTYVPPPYDSNAKLSEIIYIIDTIKKEYNSFKNNMKKKKYKYINKTISNYSNKKLKDKINFIYKNHIIKSIDNILDICDEIINEIEETHTILLDKYTNNKIKFELSTEIYKKMSFIYNYVLDVFCSCIDLYFIRRVLDKKYINNVIGYMGGFHTCNITFFLVKYFNFKIIECSYNIYNYDIKKINDVFIEASESHNIFNIFNNVTTQCVEINKNIF
jgi:hypothetical protein